MRHTEHSGGPHVGAFALKRQLGRGGMGLVWQAEHLPTGTLVAVKILAEDQLRRLDAQAAFEREVRMVASLRHDAIVQVIDYGATSPTEGAPSPYLAMELASGTLATLPPSGGWQGCSGVLQALLRGLAHAHARGVLHRDLKPANILIRGDGSVAIADFGIAWTLAGDHQEPKAVGTPAFMAPEQILADPGGLGPWTDLYSLGCLAWWMVTGAPPFSGNAAAVLQRHLTTAPGRFLPTLGVPAGLEAWLRRMLAKSPQHRYRRAADALWALEQLGSAGRGAAPAVPWREQDTMATGVIPPSHPPFSARQAQGATPSPAPPIPLSWRDGQAPTPPAPSAMGLGLHGMRHRPMVGRHTERDRLWQALTQAASGRPHLVRIVGAAGAGKSRLAQWLCERAHEVGAAQVMVARHSPQAGSEDGLGPMLRRHLRVRAGAETEAARQAWARLGGASADGDVLAAIAAGDTTGLSVRARAHATLRYLRALSQVRPVLLWVDDLQWCDAVLTSMVCKAAAAPSRLLVVATVRAGSTQAAEGDLVLQPLPDAEHVLLVRSLLGLSAQEERVVAQRTKGQPLFAVHVVADWVQRGWLVPGPTGFVLMDGVQPTVPDEVHALWLNRLELLSEADRHALEVAAVLGDQVAVQSWRNTAARLGLQVSAGTLDRVVRSELGTVEGDLMHFHHGMLAESLVRLATEAQRSRPIHSAAADELEHTHPVRLHVAARIGRHRRAAGQTLRAVPGLSMGAVAAHEQGDHAEAETLLAECDAALAQADCPPDHPLRGLVQQTRLEIAYLRGMLALGDARLDALVTDARAHGWAGEEALARWIRHCLLRSAGRTDEADAELAHAHALVDRAELDGHRSILTLASAHQALGRGDVEVCERRAREMIKGSLPHQGGLRFRAQMMLAGLDAERGDPASALPKLIALHEQEGVRGHGGRMALLNKIGDLLKQMGAHRDSVPWLEQALELGEASGQIDTPIVRFNLAHTLLCLGDRAGAERHLEAAHTGLPTIIQPGYHQLRAWAALLRAEPDQARACIAESHCATLAMTAPDPAIDEVAPGLLQLAEAGGHLDIVRSIESLLALSASR